LREPRAAATVYLTGAGRIPLFRFGAGASLGEVIRMNLVVSIGPLIALIAGILILIVPRLLNYIVAIYLIVIGLLGLFGGRLLT
jgi:hypothetical protein